MNTASSKTKYVHLEKVTLFVLTVLVCASLATYTYFIMSSVVQVVLRQELHIAIGQVETQISELEAEYFARTSELSEQTASEYGLVAVSPAAYVEVTPLGDRLTRSD